MTLKHSIAIASLILIIGGAALFILVRFGVIAGAAIGGLGLVLLGFGVLLGLANA